MKGRRKHVDTDEAKVTVPIPAFLDMTFQLLSFCVLAFNPQTKAEGQLDMYLPASIAKAEKQEDVDPFKESAAEVEPPADVTVVVESKEGARGRLKILHKIDQTAVRDLVDLEEKLRALQARLGQANVKVQAEGSLKYRYLMEVMDVCRKANFQSVGFAAPTVFAQP